MTKWVRPYEINDWGIITTVLGVPPETDLGTWGDYEKMPRLTPGKWRVRWPNGTVETAEIISRPRTGSYGEQGSPWPTTVTSERFYIRADVNGKSIWLRVVDAGIEFDVTKWPNGPRKA